RSCRLTFPTSPTSPLFPYTTLFRSANAVQLVPAHAVAEVGAGAGGNAICVYGIAVRCPKPAIANVGREEFVEPAVETPGSSAGRSEEHTSELQSRVDLVCRLLLEKK